MAREPRLQFASLGYLVLTFGAAFHESPPTQLVVAHAHPAHGAVGLLLLNVGLHCRRRALRFGGFGLFAVSLGKLFLYGLSQLSSITRALSFLAVGAVLLLAAFLTQRLTAGGADGDGPQIA